MAFMAIIMGLGLLFYIHTGDTMVPKITPIMENQMEKKLENEMETEVL